MLVHGWGGGVADDLHGFEQMGADEPWVPQFGRVYVLCFGLALGCVFTQVVVVAGGPCTFPGHLSSSASACLVCV